MSSFAKWLFFLFSHNVFGNWFGRNLSINLQQDEIIVKYSDRAKILVLKSLI